MASTSETSSAESVLVAISEVKSFIIRSLTAVGAKVEHARDMADLLVAADHRGHYSHGLNRLEYYIKDLKTGMTASDNVPEIVNETPATALVEGNNLLGAVVGNFSMDLAIEKARKVGIGWVVARGSNHFGIAGWYALRAMDQGMLGMAVTNTSPLMVPTRAKQATLGTNPISVAAPAKNGDGFVLDMATTAVALGKLEVQHRKEEPLPHGWAMGTDGQVTTDSNEAVKAELLMPLGGEEKNSGYKGYGLAMMVEVFSGLLSGSAYGHHIRHWKASGTTANLGQCFMALDPKVFTLGFEDRMSDLMEHCRGLEPVDPEKPVLAPGDPERKHVALCDAQGGIRYHINVVKAYDVIASELKIEPIKRS